MSEDTRQNIISAALAGFHAKEISAMLRVNWATVRYVISEAGLSTRPAGLAGERATKGVTVGDALYKRLLAGAMTHAQIAADFAVPVDHVRSVIEGLAAAGRSVHETNGYVFATREPVPPTPGAHIYTSREGGYYKFGYTTDNHLCSKHAREDVLDDLYDWFERERVDRVFNTGNYIEGERHSKTDIFVHGMGNQLTYLVKRYPKRAGLKTYVVSGDDHEGWYGQDIGVDIGRLMEDRAREAGRDDLINIGHVESYVRLQHADFANASTFLLAAHPGGGSAYATSYAPQKFVEALQGGEKPAVILFGHWHKIFNLLIRNVICIGGGCTKDQDMFARKKRLNYQIGGSIVELWQDSKGAIERYRVEHKQYFDRGYYNDQWSYEGGLIVPGAKR